MCHISLHKCYLFLHQCKEVKHGKHSYVLRSSIASYPGLPMFLKVLHKNSERPGQYGDVIRCGLDMVAYLHPLAQKGHHMAYAMTTLIVRVSKRRYTTASN